MAEVATTPAIVIDSPTAAETTDHTPTILGISSINENQLQIDIAEIKDITTTKITVTTVLTDTKDRITMDTTENNELLDPLVKQIFS